MDRNKLRSVSADTVNSMENSKTPNGITLSSNYNTKFISENDDVDISSAKIFTDTKFNVVNESVVKTIVDSKGLDNLGVLVFASAKHPGGGFLNGAMAQEEAIAYSSTLYGQQTTPIGKKFYDYNTKQKNKYYTNAMLIGNIELFKDDEFNLLNEPITLKAITSAAVNYSYLDKNEIKYSKKEAKEVMYSRMDRVIDLFISNGCTNIILGAFGCGVFKNNPTDIAGMWSSILNKSDKKKYFENVIFSVLSSSRDNNYDIFKSKF